MPWIVQVRETPDCKWQTEYVGDTRASALDVMRRFEEWALDADDYATEIRIRRVRLRKPIVQPRQSFTPRRQVGRAAVQPPALRKRAA